MRPLPYTNTGAGVAFYIVLVAFLVLELRVRVRSSLNPHGSSADRNSRVLTYAAIAGGIAAGFALATNMHSAAITTARWPLLVVGVFLMAAGVAVRQWAVALLGQFFTTDVRVHAGQTVVDRGPYRWVRHPSYTGLIITAIGLGLALGNWAALAALAVIPTFGLVLRIRVEERALLDAIGEPYRRFAAGRAHLFPGVW